MAVEELVKIVMDELKNLSQTDVYMGKPIQAGTATIIPVSKISMGFGAGGGGSDGDKSKSRGTGGGIQIEPVAFLVVQENTTQLLSLKEPGSPVGRLVDLIPEVIAQIKKRWEHAHGEEKEEVGD